MTKPRASQMKRRTQVSVPSEYIMAKQTMMPKIGTRGTMGARYGLGASGSERRKNITPAHTITKANKVPMEVICPNLEIGTKPAKRLTNAMNNRLDRQGVRHLG